MTQHQKTADETGGVEVSSNLRSHFISVAASTAAVSLKMRGSPNLTNVSDVTKTLVLISGVLLHSSDENTLPNYPLMTPMQHCGGKPGSDGVQSTRSPHV